MPRFVILQSVVEQKFSHYTADNQPVFTYTQKWKPRKIVHSDTAEEALQFAKYALRYHPAAVIIGMSVTTFEEWENVKHHQTADGGTAGGSPHGAAERGHRNTHRFANRQPG